MAKLQIIFVFFLIIVSIINANEPTDPPQTVFDEILPSKIVTSTEQIQDYLKNSDSTYFLYFYKRTSKNSRYGAKALVQIAEKLAYLVDILLIDCDSEYGLVAEPCIKNISEDKTVDDFPRMFVMRPPDHKSNPYTGEIYLHKEIRYTKPEVNGALLHNFITENIPSTRTLVLNSENIETFLR
jgi:hypothetical protein